MNSIEVVRAENLVAEQTTSGIIRQRAFEDLRAIVGRSRIAAGLTSGWHHHGHRTPLGFLLSGRLRFDFGPRGDELVDVRTGDFFRIPAGLIHRDVNPDGTTESVVVSVLVGEGPAVVNVEGPDPSA